MPSRHAREEGDYLLFHPVYTPEEIAAVKVVNREPQSIADKLALYGVKTVRWGFDLVSGYRHPPSTPAAPGTSLAELREKHYTLSPSEWLTRILFLETVAGVPGMVAGVLRHLRSLRGLRRDGGWIHSLLEEAENERMHLLTFLTIRNPGWFFRAAVLGAQGIFFNAFFLAYLVNPRICHRFVGYLEEEAVYTYTRAVKELENGHLPEWENYDAPQIAKDYWRLNQDAKLLDVLYAVRADESNHRFVNHTLASLNQKQDFNPFATHEPDATMKGTKYGLEREEAFRWSQQTETGTNTQTK